MTFSFEASSKQLSPYAADNLVDLLKARAVEHPSKLAYVFLEDGEREGDRLGYEDLDRRARAIAARLTSLGLRGERVLLLYPQGLPYIEAFFGCLYAGVIAVPAYPPSGRHIQRLQSIFRDATPSMILTTGALRDRFETEAQSQLSAIACGWVATDEIAVEEAESWDGYTPDPNQIAFLQYTSGSTGDPRGVMITHANLLSNESLIQKSFAHDDQCDLVGWLPLYHDMGLIGNVLQPLYIGSTAYLMSPMAFLEKPARWLKAISKYRAYTSGGPNFAYELCVRKVKEEERRELDLSCWRIAFSGAEPVRASTLDRFLAAFSDVGFSRTSFFPCYGLAEATLVVTAPHRGELVPLLKVDRQALESRNVAHCDGVKSVDIVGCGHVWSGTHVEIVHPETLVRCSESEIGEIWVRGPGVAKGYWQRPEETARSFEATIRGDDSRQYLRTGDLGFFSGGDCFISGRLKDLIIVAGRNFYPQDIESVIEERIHGVRPGCSVAFSFTENDQEALAVILEPDRSIAGALKKGGAQDFFASIRSCVVEAVDIEPSVIALVSTGSTPKTSSGKVRRSECRRRFLAGELKLLERSDRMAPAAGAGVGPAAWSPEAFIAKALPHLPRDQQVEALTRLLIANAAALLKMPEGLIAPSVTLPEAGLSSIRSVELKHRIDTTLGIETPIGLLLSDSPISSVAFALADCLGSDATGTEASPSPPSQNAPLSRAQSAMWTIHHLDPESNAYNLHLALELKGELSSAQIVSALRDVVQRHAQLRSVYAPAPLGAVQEALPADASSAWLTQENADDASDAALQRAMAAQARTPFDLDRSPPLRVTLYNRPGRPTMALFVAHHIAIDLWSLLLLLKEFDLALRTDAGSALTAEDYGQFVAREREYLSSRAAETDWAFWSKRLEGPLPVLALPERKATQGVPDYSGRSVPLRLDSAATRRLEALARKNGASLHTLLASIYFVLLHRLTGQTDLIVGTPTSGRLDRRSARLIGNCVNPVPIRLALDQSDHFTDVLRRARMEMREVLQHQLMPFPVIVERLQPERDGGHLPIYQTWFVLQEANADLPADYAALALGEAGASISLGAGEARTVKLLDRVELFDLKVMGARLGDELLLSFQYRTQVFDAGTVERFARHFETLIDDICRDPKGAIGRYRLLEDAERRQILVEWNATAAEFPRNLALHQLFEAQAARAPHALALAFEDQTLTYGELNAKANQLAHGLRRLGVGAEAIIGLCLHRSTEMVVGMLGVLKAGGAYLPLDPDNPDERLAFMIEDAAPTLVLTSTALKPRLPGAVRAVALDGDWASAASEGESNLDAIARPRNLAYVIYTSGSTGKPKGVATAHEAVVNRLDWMQKRYRLCETDVVMQKTPFGFDVSVWEFFWALSTGARLALLPPDAHRDPYQVLQAINRHGVTTLHFVPSMLQAFLSAVALRDAPSLRRVFCSGEELPATLVKRFQTESNCELHNLYGPTEAAIDVSAHQCSPCEGLRIPIGRPISNVSLYILDSNLEPAAIGTAGDLYIGGVGLARGYLRAPGLTADRFVPSPFDEPGGRLYRTGDVARYRADGEIEYLGRSDHQVKVRGFRIELGEIEAALSALDNVAQAVAVVPPAHDGGRVIVAYVTGDGVDVDQIRMGLQRCLPEYMIPHFIVALDEMPLSRNGKIDRKALPAHSAVVSSAGEYVAPASREEEAVVEAFADALGLERVSAHDGFFRLGGDSIRAIQVAARLRQAGYEVTPRQLFERQTAVALAPALRRLGDADAQVENDRRALRALAPNFALAELNPEEIAGLRLEFGDVEDAYPLTPMQEGMYFHALSHSGTGLYHMQERYEIKGALDIPKFAEAWQCVVDRHPNLRTSFRAAANGRVHQIVLGRARLDVTVDAIDHLSADEQDAYVDDQLKAERAEGFDLSQAPLVRIRIIRLSADRHICVRSFHHIIMDDWCTSPLLLDMRQHYAAALRGEAPHTAPAGRFHDYIAWLRIRDVAAAEKFWRSYLEGFSEPTPLVGATALSQDAAENVADAIVRISPESYEKLKTLAQQSQLTVNTFVQGALALLLSVLSGREEVVFGVTVSGRPIDLPGVESTLGLFINGLPLRVKLRRDTKVVDWLRDILSDNLEMRQHEFLSQPAIQRCSAISRADALLFQHLLTFENAPIDPSLRSEKDVLDIDLLQLRVHTNYPLTFVAIPDGDLTLRLTYDRERFDPAFIETVAERFKRAVEELAAKFDRPLGEVSLLSREEHSTLLEISGGRDFDYGSPLDLVDRFEAQALREPETVAARCDGASLSYGELNKRANELAHVLIREGVGPDVIVAVLDARGLDFLMMLLAIFKAGAAYLPLDPAHPDGRITQVLEESRATFLLLGRDMLARGQTIVSGLSDAAQQQQPQLLALEALQDKRGATSNPARCHSPDNLAFIIYTSGSTGKPKGAMVEHRGMFNNLITKVPALGLTTNDVIAQTASQCFDISVWQFLTALAIGARVEIFPDAISRDPRRLGAEIAARGVTILEAVPSMIRALLDLTFDDEMPLAGLRWLLPCGEAFAPELCRRFMARYPQVRLMNAYGPAECSDDVSYYPIETSPAGDDLSVPIGRPVDNTQIYLLDRWLEPVPVGVASEICIGGVQVGRGYLHRPDLTAAAFTPNPFGPPGSRLYRSGDLGRWRDDSVIDFLGRVDHQVKIRGHRIEPDEVVASLLTHPGVGTATVIARAATPGVYQLVAYVVAQAGALEIDDLRLHLQQTLPHYMIPAAFVFLEALPLTPNGKVDRKALPAPDLDAQTAHTYVAPRTPTEAALCRIWADVLGLARVGVNDNFFELGGHSLLAMTLIEKMRRAGLRSDVRALFAQPTPTSLAAVLEEGVRIAVPPNLIPSGCAAITPQMLPLAQLMQEEIDRIVAAIPGGASNVQDIYPLTALQEGILFHHLMADKGDPYIRPTILSFDAYGRVESFCSAVREVIARHDILRTSVFWEGLREPVQVVWREALLIVEEIRLDPTEGDVVLQLREMFNPRHYRTDVTKAPMVRIFVAHDPTSDHWNVALLNHHLIEDATSLRLLLSEVSTFMSGDVSQLPASLPFRDFVARARHGISTAEHEAFFREMLGDVTEPTAAFGMLNTQGDGSGVEEAELFLDPGFAKRLRVAAQALGSSAASLCHQAFAQVLSRLASRDDVVFGTVLFGRMLGGAGADRAIGMFINTLPIRIHIVDEGVADSLRRVHGLLTGLLKHEHASLALAQRCSGIDAPTPLFSALLNYRHNMNEKSESGEVSLDLEGVVGLYSEERTNYPLSLAVDDFGNGFRLIAQTQNPIDPHAVCDYMRVALERLVTALEDAPQTPARSIDILSEEARDHLLAKGSNASTAYLPNFCIHELFEQQAAKTPGELAVVFEDETLSYGELDAKADRLACRLVDLGVGPESLVGICLEPSVDILVAIFGVLKAGGAYVPVDPSYPAARIEFILADVNASALLTRRKHSAMMAYGGAPAIFMDDDAILRDANIEEAIEKRINSNNLAYVIYTSGSTGQPKGVAVTHKSIVSSTLARKEYYGDGPTGFLLLSSVAFDSSIAGIFSTLTQGGTLYLIGEETRRDPAALARLIDEKPISDLLCLPSLYSAILLALTPEQGKSLTRCIVAGEECTRDIVLEHLRRAPGASLYNEYGPTECSVWSTVYRIERHDDASGPIPIGRAISGAQTLILNADCELSCDGVPGELWIASAGVARGYLNRPALTAEKFRPNPFGRPGERMYRTGDLASYRRDGNIEFLGRVDYQVKIRGHRIEPGEVAACLLIHPAVAGATVVARAVTPGVYRLIAYVVVRDGAVEIDALRRHLQQTLPDYMIPAAFVFLEALPLTANGKIDRKALPEPDGAASVRDYVAPRTPTEASLCRIWADVLGLERVGVNDNFFELGGHSLLAMTLIEKMRCEGFRSDVRSLFAQPTPRALSAVLEDGDMIVVPPNLIPAGCEAITPEMLTLANLTQGEIDRIVSAVPGGAANVQEIYPLTPLQEGILFHHLMAERGDPYLVTALFAFDNRARFEGFHAALRAVIARHDILRTAVMWEGLREPAQVVWREAPLVIEEASLDPAAGDVGQQLLERFNPRRIRLDVRQAPMMRGFVAYDETQSRWVLLLLSHHLAFDNATSEVLWSEVHANAAGWSTSLPAPTPYRNFVAQARLGVSKAEHEAFFTKMLADVTEATAPFGLLDVQGDGSGVEEARLDVDLALARRARAAARALGVSVASLWHLAFAQVLARVSGRHDVVFGTVLFGRMHGGVEADRAIGLFINTLPIRVQIGQQSVRDSARIVQDRLTALLRHEHAPLALAQRCSGIEAPAPLFSALLNYRHSTPEKESVAAFEGVTELYAQERTNYPLTLSIDDFGDGFGLEAQTQHPLEPSVVCGYMRTALEGLVTFLETAPETPALTIDVLSEAERHKLLVEWNDTAADYPKDRCIHELFEAQAAQTPDSVAVVFEEQSLTYGELNARANRLAHYLRRLGVGPETLVGVCVERSLEMIVGLLGVLKAGGAYLPLDPDYPADRLAFMLADARPLLTLTQDHLRHRLPEGATTLSLDADWLSIAENSGDNPRNLARPQNLAYVIYTSGSTGIPKGVGVPHDGIVNCVKSFVRRLKLGGGDRLLAVTRITFDIAALELYLPLSVGASVILAKHERVLDSNYLVDVVASEQIDVMQATPAFWQHMVNCGWAGAPNLTVLVGGELVPQSLGERLAQICKQAIDVYGPTEATIWSTETLIIPGRPLVVGRPILNTQIYLLDESLEPVPVGVSGELYIGGAGLARGYLDRPDLTAERFIPNPFGPPGRRLYRTGDLARYHQDGNIEYLGRTDHQVKIRGFRIELGEIEAALRRLEAVREAVALARDDSSGDKRIVAYVVGEGGAEPSVAQLRASLTRDLPDYMVPSAFVFLEALPLTPNGKIDRKALPAPDGAASVRDYVAPRTPTEASLCRIWADVLGLERVGVNDNFFELGGHSLLAVQLMIRISGELDAPLPLSTFYQAPDLATLAESIELIRALTPKEQLAEVSAPEEFEL